MPVVNFSTTSTSSFNNTITLSGNGLSATFTRNSGSTNLVLQSGGVYNVTASTNATYTYDCSYTYSCSYSYDCSYYYDCSYNYDCSYSYDCSYNYDCSYSYNCSYTYDCTYAANICTCPVCCGKSCTNSAPCSGGYTTGNGCAEGGLRWFCPRTCTQQQTCYVSRTCRQQQTCYVSRTCRQQRTCYQQQTCTQARTCVQQQTCTGYGVAKLRVSGGRVELEEAVDNDYNDLIVTPGEGFFYQQNGQTFYQAPITPAPTVTVSLSKSSMINNGSDSATLTWSITGYQIQSVTVTGQTNPSTNGTVVVKPTSTTVYTVTATNEGGTTIQRVTLTVYQVPKITLSLSSNPIILGQSSVLSWSVSGDADKMTIFPGIGETNVSSLATVSPTVTTTYRAYASGYGGSDTKEITLTVYQPPTISLSGPLNIRYGDSLLVNYSTTNTNSITAIVRYIFKDESYAEDTLQLPAGNSSYTITNIPWGAFGPFSVRITATAYGYGDMTRTTVITVPVVIDENPDLIDIPQSEDKIRDEEPVVTPDVEVTTEQITISDIDIPVEIKAEYPIQVEIDNDGNWRNIREM